jgi:hypothetical protein
MCLAGKLGGWDECNLIRPGNLSVLAVVAASGSSEAPSAAGHLFFVQDQQSRRKFLVDTGSSYSLIPYRSKTAPHGPMLKATNNERVHCWGTSSSAVKIGGKSYTWTFI